MPYKASIVYEPTTLRRLNKAITSTFHSKLKAIYLAICLGLMFIGVQVGLATSKGVALVCIAVFILPSIRLLDRNKAEQMIQRLNGKTVRLDYSFEDDRFVCEGEGERNEFRYDSIIRLVEESDYLYMFPNSAQGYMIAVSTIQGVGVEKFKQFISKKTGLEWTKPVSLFIVNLRQLRFNKKNTKNLRK